MDWVSKIICAYVHLLIIFLRYVEWEEYPEKKEVARSILEQKRFPHPPGANIGVGLFP